MSKTLTIQSKGQGVKKRMHRSLSPSGLGTKFLYSISRIGSIPVHSVVRATIIEVVQLLQRTIALIDGEVTRAMSRPFATINAYG